MKTLFVIFTIALTTTIVNAQSFTVEYWNLITGESVTSISNVFVTKPIGARTNFQAFCLVSAKGFAEFYTGVERIVHDNLSLGVSIGFKNESELRVSPSIVFVKGRFLSINLAEWSPDGDYWYTSHQMVCLSEKLKAGIMSRRFLGVGPRVEYNLSKKVVLWSSVNYDYESESMKGSIAVRLSM